MSFSIRLSAEEKSLAESYAKLHAMSLGEAFKKALFEKIEDEFDLKEFETALAEYKANPTTYSHADVSKMVLGD